jgi:hypothetical protein
MGETSSLAMPIDFTSTTSRGQPKDDTVDHMVDGKEEAEEDGYMPPPPTPLAPQFGKAPSSTKAADALSKSSASSASLTTMTNTLLSGGPLVQNYPSNASLSSNISLNSLGSALPSPLSPAVMLHQSASPETLLFPPQPSTPVQHRSWLQELNARAMAARQSFMTAVTPRGPPTSNPSMAAPPPILPILPNYSSSVPPQAAGRTAYLSAVPVWMNHPATAAQLSSLAAASPPPVESEEKRAKRLERNRESARKSRRRKKDRLESLEAAIRKLHGKIATERLVQIEGMVGSLQEQRRELRLRLDQSEAPRIAMRETGPRSSIFQSVEDFNYGAIKSALLPPYQKFWLWAALQEESFFLAGKQEYVRTHENVSIGRISSKQVGEECSKTSGPQQVMQEDEGTPQSKQTSYAYDTPRLWPMVCFEHQFSVDQEERFVALNKRLKESEDEQYGGIEWNRAVDSVEAVSSLQQAMESVCVTAVQREERTWVGVLTPEQSSLYQQWLNEPGRLEFLRPPKRNVELDANLSEICKRLQQVAISQTER